MQDQILEKRHICWFTVLIFNIRSYSTRSDLRNMSVRFSGTWFWLKKKRMIAWKEAVILHVCPLPPTWRHCSVDWGRISNVTPSLASVQTASLQALVFMCLGNSSVTRVVIGTFRFTHLVAPYCAIPRDYLSDTPLLRAMGFLVPQHGQLGVPLFWAFPPWRAYKVEVRYPPSKGVSQRYLRDTLWKQGKWVRYPPLRYYLERVLRDMGGYLALGR